MVDADTHPQTLAVLATRAEPIGIEIELFDRLGGAPQGEYFGILLSYPGSSGSIGGDFAAIAQAAKSAGAIAAVTAVHGRSGRFIRSKWPSR